MGKFLEGPPLKTKNKLNRFSKEVPYDEAVNKEFHQRFGIRIEENEDCLRNLKFKSIQELSQATCNVEENSEKVKGDNFCS